MGDSDRRNFLRAAGAGGLLLVEPRTAFGTQANSTVEIGIVGCGGRGNWIGPFFPEFAGARIVALADVIKANLDRTREKFTVDAGRAYHGPDAFRELANSKVDAVVIETPTYFHPEHARAAVEAGKHVFMAKPVAVDVWGCQDVLASAAAAKKRNLSYLVDFQTRAQPVYQETARRIHRGDLGAPVFSQVFYFAGRPSKDKGQPGMDPGQRRLMNFYMDKVLGGDIIVEQNIHVIDVANWFLQGHPLKATGTGGRTNWEGTGYEGSDAWDHFLVHYDYPNGVHADFSSHQLTNAFSDLCVRVFGLNGMADTHYGGMVRINGPNAWMGAEKDNTFRDGAINNVKAFIQAIRENKPVNNAETAVESNLTAILGRMAAYKHGTVTWGEMMASGERWTADLKLRW
ncbi:MAG: Gfo/Idh/MocA family oxidoreductase [Bryobacteraceae bacterium]|nr:Gfo/Idh/MocA family oxidoreductase [Solibacteraceae bacterium]MCL4841846.1 Gfo/Idh/MocA family oxidoreductase [Bryobacteraceae bacterium]MCO5353016.1 Gfo/Idh/MocA family oxidoreductase [Bryobacteraceae bacterium]